jgi:hypothetical protein
LNAQKRIKQKDPRGATSPRAKTTRALFLSESTSVEVPIEIVTREEESILFLGDHPDWGGPYLIKGARLNGYYAGQDVDNGAIARWAVFGDVHVGVWFEHGDEYLFSFRLPRT